MNYLNNPIFNVLSKIRWNFHLIFTFPEVYQKDTSHKAIRIRRDIFRNFISRLSGFVRVPSRKQIFTYADEISSSDNGHIHTLYKLPEKYQRKDQEFIVAAKGIWMTSLGIPKAESARLNPLCITQITNESFKNKISYNAEIINKSDSSDYLSKAATSAIKRCNNQYGNFEIIP